MRILVALLVGLVLCAGCTTVKVKRVCHPDQQGIRYYRPKPYLFISGKPVQQEEKKPVATIFQNEPFKVGANSLERFPTTQAANFESDLSTSFKQSANSTSANRLELSMSLQYLPDFSEEYAIQYRPGLGKGELKVELENGWNLKSIGIVTDQQTDEIITSVASLISSLPMGVREGPPGSNPQHGIYGTNVPLGYYEAVIAEDRCGRKQMYGWRYVGFMPFQHCPTRASGAQCFNCESEIIYGLVMIDGILQFAAIDEIPTHLKTHVDSVGRESVVPGQDGESSSRPALQWNQ